MAQQPNQPTQPDPDDIATLRAIVEATASATGPDFFTTLVTHLATALNTGYALVAEFVGDLASNNLRARTLGYWKPAGLAPNIEWDLAGSPCEDVIKGTLCHHPSGTAALFPNDKPLTDWGIESYLGVPLIATDGQHLGHLAVFDTKPMPDEPRKLFLFRIFAARAAAELQRLRDEHRLRDSERRYRDLYEEAPIAYIYEDLDSRFVRANRAATSLLGLKEDEVTSTLGVTLLAPTPETQQKIAHALHAMKHEGKEFAAVELELRRKDDGRPIWVQWWSKPEPDGKHTRTMLVDITQRVLMEREKARLQQQNVYLQEEIKSVHNFEEIVGRSPALVTVLENVRHVAPTDASVLITGETGTGKELIARALHNASSRKDNPLIKVNCAALPSGLVESELFGHEKGAFSGAIARRTGRFELAHTGTLFLDEIGDLPLDVQAKLLRVLQEREFERVGGSTPIKVDVRLIAATNRDLHKAVASGAFRQDLFYRLNVFPIHLPPLRSRPDDIPLLAQFFTARFAQRNGRRIEAISASALQRLAAYPWPGNVRELENILERAVILCSSPVLDIDPALLAAPVAAMPPSDLSLKSTERNHILRVLQQSHWVIDGEHGAAKRLDMHPNTLRSRLKKLGITRPAHEPS